MFLGIDNNFPATQPLNYQGAVFDRHAKPVHAEPADRDVDVEVI